MTLEELGFAMTVEGNIVSYKKDGIIVDFNLEKHECITSYLDVELANEIKAAIVQKITNLGW